MFELAGLFLVFAVVGVFVFLAKLLFGLILIPFKIGFAAIKLVLGLLLGLPLLILGGIAVVALVPVGLILLPLLLVALVVGILVLPIVAIVKIFT
jgi:hypothetical protein